jgi:hypothetical protein
VDEEREARDHGIEGCKVELRKIPYWEKRDGQGEVGFDDEAGVVGGDNLGGVEKVNWEEMVRGSIARYLREIHAE